MKYNSAHPVKPSTEGEIIEAGDDCGYNHSATDWHLSQAARSSVSGTVVCIRIEKIGLKDAQEYIDPIMTVLVADPKTNLLDTHDTAVARERRATHVMFNHQVYLNISLEDMQRQGAA